MYNISSRLQSLLNNAVTSSTIIIFIIILSSLAQMISTNVWSLDSSISSVKPQMSIKKSYNYGAINRKPKENSKISFDLDVDLEPLFNWNTKQVFIYLTAEYPGKSENSSNKVTYWDKIVTKDDPKTISLKDAKSKYSVWDVEKSFREREATVRLEWNIQPYFGPLYFGKTKAEVKFNYLDPHSKPGSNKNE